MCTHSACVSRNRARFCKYVCRCCCLKHIGCTHKHTRYITSVTRMYRFVQRFNSLRLISRLALVQLLTKCIQLIICVSSVSVLRWMVAATSHWRLSHSETSWRVLVRTTKLRASRATARQLAQHILAWITGSNAPRVAK